MTAEAGDEPTCGKGLAAHSALPAAMGELIDASAENLDAHLTALDPNDPQSRPEHDAYVALVAEHRRIAAQLAATADRMASYRALPMANHDPAAMAAPRVGTAFERLVRSEESLIAQLRNALEMHRSMLGEGGPDSDATRA